MDSVAEVLFTYLRDAIYDPESAVLDMEKLPQEFKDFGEGLQYFVECVTETKMLAQALSKGDLTGKIPPPDNEIASPLKSLHASLRHLTWQTQQVAQGDYQQRVKFMGEFSTAFNQMTQQLEERRKTNIREKSELRQYINLILSNTPDILLVFNTEGKAVLANETYRQIRKIAMDEEVIGKSFAELFSSISTEGFLQNIESLVKDAHDAGNTIKTEESLDFSQAGIPRTYLISITPMLNVDKRQKGTMVVFHDMTEIMQAKIEAERTREIAEQSSQAKSEFLARMSYEMRAPMNAIMGMTAIGKATADIEKKDYSFQKIEDASMHLLGVINDVIDMSMIENNQVELSFNEFSLKEMLDNIMSSVDHQISAKEQEFVISIDENVPPVIFSDEQRLSQVITNLLANAVEFTPKHGKITLKIKKLAETDESCTIRFAVKDTGIGVPKKRHKSLFTAFEQADGNISREFEGTSLGLTISKNIVEMMGGRIWVESTPGKGSALIFEIKVQERTKADTAPKTVETAQNSDFTW